MTIDNRTVILALLAYDEAMHEKPPTIPNKLAAMRAALNVVPPLPIPIADDKEVVDGLRSATT